MKSIFKRYCLTHTYLSIYVKTSNENKYHRGAKSCLGKWIPEWIDPFIPDVMPYGVGQSRWSEQSRLGESPRETHQGRSLQEFFISDGARFGRIRKTPEGTPSPQEYTYKKELLQELEHQCESGLIVLYYGDESHICTEGYLPYAWKFKDEDFCVPVYKCERLNIFGMIDRNCVYHGFTTEHNINSGRFIEFMENFSLGIRKETVVVLDNSAVHKSRKVKDCLQRWKERGFHIFYLFYLPPYSPHLNIAETLWRVLKGKWIQPHHYGNKHGLFSTVEDILSNVGKKYMIKFSRPAA